MKLPCVCFKHVLNIFTWMMIVQKRGLTFDFLLNLGFDLLFHKSHCKTKTGFRFHFCTGNNIESSWSSKEEGFNQRNIRRGRNEVQQWVELPGWWWCNRGNRWVSGDGMHCPLFFWKREWGMEEMEEDTEVSWTSHEGGAEIRPGRWFHEDLED